MTLPDSRMGSYADDIWQMSKTLPEPQSTPLPIDARTYSNVHTPSVYPSSDRSSTPGSSIYDNSFTEFEDSQQADLQLNRQPSLANSMRPRPQITAMNASFSSGDDTDSISNILLASGSQRDPMNPDELRKFAGDYGRLHHFPDTLTVAAKSFAEV